MNERRCQHVRLSRPFRAEDLKGERFPWGAALRLAPRPHSKAPCGSGSITVGFLREDCGRSSRENVDVSPSSKGVHYSDCPGRGYRCVAGDENPRKTKQ
ncbi:MAG: hypothetical protein AB7H80_03555 [Candidatus Kapaibacterium sp.]